MDSFLIRRCTLLPQSSCHMSCYRLHVVCCLSWPPHTYIIPRFTIRLNLFVLFTHKLALLSYRLKKLDCCLIEDFGALWTSDVPSSPFIHWLVIHLKTRLWGTHSHKVFLDVMWSAHELDSQSFCLSVLCCFSFFWRGPTNIARLADDYPRIQPISLQALCEFPWWDAEIKSNCQL